MGKPALQRRMPWWAVVAILVGVGEGTASPFKPDPVNLPKLNAGIKGRVLDFTHNHGVDRRFWSHALGEKRDMYVYLPPGYDGLQKLPIVIWLHGGLQDERGVTAVAKAFDQAIVSGVLQPLIVAVPDGSIDGRPTILRTGSFYLNTRAGCFEDYIRWDVWPLLQRSFPIRPDRESHILAGASMGGFAALNLGIKYRDQFHLLVGMMPLVNMRYADCHGDQFGPFDPECMGVQERYRPLAAATQTFPRLRYFMVLGALYHGPTRVQNNLWRENPPEMLAPYCVKPGDIKAFFAYGTCDKYNAGAQVESFLHEARRLGLGDDVSKEVFPGLGHNSTAGQQMFGAVAQWLAGQLKTPVGEPSRYRP